MNSNIRPTANRKLWRIFPSLHSIAIFHIMQGLPVIINLINENLLTQLSKYNLKAHSDNTTTAYFVTVSDVREQGSSQPDTEQNDKCKVW